MKTFKHIIAAVDFTPSCLRALREAIHRASTNGAAVTVVHVMDEMLVEELKQSVAAARARPWLSARWAAAQRAGWAAAQPVLCLNLLACVCLGPEHLHRPYQVAGRVDGGDAAPPGGVCQHG